MNQKEFIRTRLNSYSSTEYLNLIELDLNKLKESPIESKLKDLLNSGSRLVYMKPILVNFTGDYGKEIANLDKIKSASNKFHFDRSYECMTIEFDDEKFRPIGKLIFSFYTFAKKFANGEMLKSRGLIFSPSLEGFQLNYSTKDPKIKSWLLNKFPQVDYDSGYYDFYSLCDNDLDKVNKVAIEFLDYVFKEGIKLPYGYFVYLNTSRIIRDTFIKPIPKDIEFSYHPMNSDEVPDELKSDGKTLKVRVGKQFVENEV